MTQAEQLQRLKTHIVNTLPGSPEEAEFLKQIETLEAELKNKSVKTTVKVEHMEYDIFLSHNSKDEVQVENIAVWLRDRGIHVWFSKWNSMPGSPWQKKLEEGLLQSRSIAVFLGASGFGGWGTMEMRTAVNLGVKCKKPVILILLPDCPEEPELPPFIEEYTWIDFRSKSDVLEYRNRLLSAIIYHREHPPEDSRL